MDSKTVAALPPFEATPLEDIPKICEGVRRTFRTNRTKSLEWRKVQLRKLYWAMKDYTPQLEAALHRDLRKAPYEAHMTEIDWITNDCTYMLANLDAFAKDKRLRPPHVPLAFQQHRVRIHPEPLGACLIIGTYNLPIQLLLAPLVGAIAAGCTAVVKPSEGAPHVAMAVRDMLEARLDPSAFRVVNGAVPETTALLDERWDKILYTGSAHVGRIVARKAAEHLTPVTLELGGRNPAFVTRHADLRLAARRLLWGKTLCAGQVCLSHNYVLVERPVLDGFVEQLRAASRDFFPEGAQRSPDLCRIVNERQFLRIKKMVDETKGRVVLGGEMDQAELFIAPTAVLVDSPEDAVMAQESFGPVFAVMPYDSLSDAIRTANDVCRTPLAMSVFGTRDENERLLAEVTSGGACYNDGFFHAQLNNAPFGGVGESGMGAYRGRASFDTFTHFRTLAETPRWAEKLMRVRYMPYDPRQMPVYRLVTESSPDFDRSGRVVRGLGYWARLVLGLGGRGAQGAFVRWLAAAAAAYAWLVLTTRRQ